MKQCILILAIYAATLTAWSADEKVFTVRPVAKTSAGGQRWALVIGISDYVNVPKLRFARQDAEQLAATLINDCGFPKENVVLMTDAVDARTSKYPTYGNVRARINQLATVAKEKDVLFVSFSGHGVNLDGQGYLVPVDGSANDRFSLVPLSWVKSTIETCAAHQRLLVLDACHAGAKSGGESPAKALLSPLSGAAFMTLASCDSDELSHERADTKHGVFTTALIEGLRGAADREAEGNRDNAVTASELFHFASLRVRQWCLASGKTQTPVLEGRFKGRLELARYEEGATPAQPAWTPAPVVTPRPTPTLTPRPTARKPKTGDTKAIDLGSGVKLTLVWIEGGSFMMGSPDDEEGGGGAEGPVHKVAVDGFWMGQTEVTQVQYEALMGKNPSEFKGSQNPVEKVLWHDAKSFCARLSARVEGTARLPYEAEWEYACRAGTSTPFHTGPTISANQANYDGNYTYGSGRKGVNRKKTTPAKSFSPNAWGLYDMHGNVWEWCEDWLGVHYYSSSPSSNPKGASSGWSRVLRGGSWDHKPLSCRSANRGGNAPNSTVGNYGFRVVCISPGLD